MELNNQESILHAIIIVSFILAVLFFVLWRLTKSNLNKYELDLDAVKLDRKQISR